MSNKQNKRSEPNWSKISDMLLNKALDWCRLNVRIAKKYGFDKKPNFVWADTQDLVKLAYLIDQKQYRKAYNKAIYLDSIVRDDIPAAFWKAFEGGRVRKTR